jgi:hypothetical protein
MRDPEAIRAAYLGRTDEVLVLALRDPDVVSLHRRLDAVHRKDGKPVRDAAKT